MIPETPQQRANRLLAEDQARRVAGYGRFDSERIGKIHDQFCRCRACKPPLVNAPWPVRALRAIRKGIGL